MTIATTVATELNTHSIVAEWDVIVSTEGYDDDMTVAIDTDGTVAAFIDGSAIAWAPQLGRWIGTHIEDIGAGVFAVSALLVARELAARADDHWGEQVIVWAHSDTDIDWAYAANVGASDGDLELTLICDADDDGEISRETLVAVLLAEIVEHFNAELAR